MYSSRWLQAEHLEFTRSLANARTLFLPCSDEKTAHRSSYHDGFGTADLDVVIFGKSASFTAAVLVRNAPALEGAADKTPESALRQLLLASAEVLEQYIPKLAGHQRTIHDAGGIFDEDMVALPLMEAKNKVTNGY